MSDQPPPQWGPQGGAPGPGGQWGGPPGGGFHPGQQPPGQQFPGQPPGAGGFGGPPGGPGGFGPPPGPGGPGGLPPGAPGTPGGPSGGRGSGPIIIGVIAAVVVIGGIIAGVLLLRGGDDGDVAVSGTPTAVDTPSEATPSPDPEPTPTAEDTATAAPRPTGTMPEAPPEPPAVDPDVDPVPAPAAPGSTMAMNEGVTGEITAAAPAVDFVLDGVAGEQVVLTMTAVDASLDPVMRLYAPDGTLLDENDDDPTLSPATDSRIVTTLPVDGEYRIEATSFAQTTGAFAISLSFPSVLSATDVLSDAVPEIDYTYDGTAGQTIIVEMRGLDDQVDPYLRILDPSGAELAFDDDGGTAPLDSRIQLTLPADGTYTIVASTFADRFGAFELTVVES